MYIFLMNPKQISNVIIVFSIYFQFCNILSTMFVKSRNYVNFFFQIEEVLNTNRENVFQLS